MRKDSNNKRAEEILNSFDGISPSEVPAFFYTRLEARMQRELAENIPAVFYFRPAFLTLSLLFVLILNIFSLLRSENKAGLSPVVKSETSTGIQSFADAYDLNSSSVY